MATIRGEDTVRVSGLNKLRRELKALEDPTHLADLKAANNKVATDVVGWARVKAGSQGAMAVKASRSLKAGNTQARATVSFGGKGYEFAAGSEFGADRNMWRIVRGREIRAKQYQTKLVDSEFYGKQVRRRVRTADAVTRLADRRVRGWNQFRPWRGNGEDAGYWLWPAIRAHTDDIVDTYGDAIEKITSKAFPD